VPARCFGDDDAERFLAGVVAGLAAEAPPVVAVT
jgi:hypothetical protein